MTDRPYQERTHNAIRKAIAAGHRRILVVAPTGAGKGYQIARIMQDATAKGNPSIFFADQRELVKQLGNQLNRLTVPHHVLLSGVRQEFQSSADLFDALSVVAAKDTLWARAFRTDKINLPEARIVQFDEAHRSLAQTWRGIAEAYSDAILVGWTATPCRLDGRGLGDLYDHLIIGATYSELQAGGYLVPVRIWAPHRPDLKGLKTARGDYVKGELAKRMDVEKLVGDIVQDWKQRADGRQTVCFASSIAHSIHIRDIFRRAGISAEHLDGKTPQEERDEIMGRVADGEITVLCNYGVATTGVDVPAWKYMINARPTKSFSLWRQMAGRIMRKCEGHDHCVIQDHSDCSLRFGFPDEDVNWTLDTTEKIQERHEREKKEKKVKDPYACEECSTVYRGPHCPECGTRPTRKGKEVKLKPGQLKELERAKARKNDSHQDKQKHWDECLGWAIGNGKKLGAAAARYKDRYGVFPSHKIENVPRSSQWQMSARDFYTLVVKPAKQAALLEI